MVKGEGKPCTDPIAEKEACFQGCCNNEFDCIKGKEKCIGHEKICDYADNCEQNEDEDDVMCQEKCFDL